MFVGIEGQNQIRFPKKLTYNAQSQDVLHCEHHVACNSLRSKNSSLQRSKSAPTFSSLLHLITRSMSHTRSSNPLSLMSHSSVQSSVNLGTYWFMYSNNSTSCIYCTLSYISIDTISSTTRLSSIRDLFIVGYCPTTLLVHIPISALPTLRIY